MSTCCLFLPMPSAATMPSICARRCSTRVTSPNRITPSIPTCKNGYIIWIEIVVTPILIEQPHARHNAFKSGSVTSEVECRRDSEKVPEQSIWPENSDHPVRFIAAGRRIVREVDNHRLSPIDAYPPDGPDHAYIRI